MSTTRLRSRKKARKNKSRPVSPMHRHRRSQSLTGIVFLLI